MPEWLNVSRETIERFEVFVTLVEKWNPVVNLVSKRSMTEIWDRHVFDSAQIFTYVPGKTEKLVDLGTGGGFPGVVVAIMARELSPQIRVVLVEADQRKAAFLVEACRHLSLSVTVLTQRIEALVAQQADVVTARALAPLSTLCAYAHRHLCEGGVALFAKGVLAEREIADAKRDWLFTLVRHPSRVDPAASLLALADVRHV